MFLEQWHGKIIYGFLNLLGDVLFDFLDDNLIGIWIRTAAVLRLLRRHGTKGWLRHLLIGVLENRLSGARRSRVVR